MEHDDPASRLETVGFVAATSHVLRDGGAYEYKLFVKIGIAAFPTY